MAEAAVLEHNEHDHHEPVEDWGGGVRPMEASYGKLMMWYFLLSDAFTFGALLITYATLRITAGWREGWSSANDVFKTFPGVDGIPILEALNGVPLAFVTLMTFILILSSVFVVLAVIEGHRMNKKGVIFWMILGILGGIAFLGCQAAEWYGLIVHEGLTMAYNPFPSGGGELNLGHPHGVELATSPGPKAFGNLFFFITGFHGFHVFSGVIFNIIILVRVIQGLYEERGHYEMVEKVGLYWHFVDLVWVFVFLVFYLL